MSRIIKCVIVGDCGCGKTSLLRRYIQKIYHDYHEPTVACEGYFTRVCWNNTLCLELWDTSGEDDYQRLRSLAYKNADIFIICFAVENSSDFLRVPQHWLAEIRKFRPRSIPIVLVATKVDLRDEYHYPQGIAMDIKRAKVHINYAQGFAMAKEIGAVAYIECSAQKDSGLTLLFDTVAASGLYYRPQEKVKSTKCQCGLM